MRYSNFAPLFLAALGLAACGQEPFPQGPQTGPADDVPELTEPPIDQTPGDQTSLRIDGIGGVTIGESLAEASADLGETLTHHEASEGSTCSYAFSQTLPGIAFMLDGETIVRIDVTEGGITTPEGIGIGSTEEAVLAAYDPNVTATPHKYVDGQYLTVGDPSASDTSLRYVFETDGSAVTAYRAGRVPEVEWIEGCS